MPIVLTTPGLEIVGPVTLNVTLGFTDTTLDFTTPLAGGFTRANVADGDAAMFTGVPARAEGVKGYRIRLSDDGKEIKVVSKDFCTSCGSGICRDRGRGLHHLPAAPKHGDVGAKLGRHRS